MTSTASFALSASKPLERNAKREQNSRYGHNNGLKRCNASYASATDQAGAYVGQEEIECGVFGLVVASAVAACGLYTPDKDPFSSDAPIPPSNNTRQGIYEDAIVHHVTCEISHGLVAAQQLKLPFPLSKWGTTVTITITIEDQTGLAPGISLFPFPSLGNVSTPQLFSLSIGGSASVNALRTETIKFTIKNEDLILRTLVITSYCLAYC
jgi:hypothetical protein